MGSGMRSEFQQLVNNLQLLMTNSALTSADFCSGAAARHYGKGQLLPHSAVAP